MVSISESEICDVVHLVDIQSLVTHYRKSISLYNVPEADPGFQVRGSALKEIAPSGGRREIFWVFRVKNHDFTQKKSYFFQLRREARNFWGISCEKSRFYAKKSYFFQF